MHKLNRRLFLPAIRKKGSHHEAQPDAHENFDAEAVPVVAPFNRSEGLSVHCLRHHGRLEVAR
jgi:hypothetical protein